LIGLIPFIGPIIILVWYCTEGTKGPNKYGPDPKAAEENHLNTAHQQQVVEEKDECSPVQNE